MHKALYPKDYVDSIEDSVDAAIQRLEEYIEKFGERLITAKRNSTGDTRTNRIEITRKQKWEKQLYGRFTHLSSDVSHEKGKLNLF